MPQQNALQSFQRLETASSICDLRSAMQQIAAQYGFASWCFVDAGRAYQNLPLHVSSPANEWTDIYRDNGFLHVDPYVAKARRCNTPFEWASIPSEKSRRGPKNAARKLMDGAYDFGFTEGLVVPFHFRDDIGRLHSTLCVFHWREDVRSFSHLFAARKLELHLTALYFVQRAMALLATEKRGDPSGLMVEREESTLSDRERDVLSWAARGKTAFETAEILQISNMTVEKHIANAMAKLNASNRTHAVVKSITLGLIDP